MATGVCCIGNSMPGGCCDGGISTTGRAAPARYNLLPRQPERPGIPPPPGAEGWGGRNMVVEIRMWREEMYWCQIQRKDKDSQHSRKRTGTKTNKQKGKAVSTEDLPFWKNGQKLAIKKKGGKYTRFAWAGGTFFPVVLLLQFFVLAGNRFWFYILIMY
jgi:hypothetical protein